jgi:3-oxoacyl-[acyl-carrier protein] reductase
MSKNHILITGASSAIGSEIIRRIADNSTIILAQYHSNPEQLTALRNEVPGEIIPIQADLRDEDGIASLVETVSSHCEAPGKIVLLAAPRLTLVRFKDLAWEDFRAHHEMPLRTAVTLLGRFLPRMAKARFGRVVFMLSSVTMGVPPSAMAHYVTAKYALLGLMRATAGEYASKGITINGVAPSMVETGFLLDIPEKLVELAAQQHPLNRNATPADIAPLIKYILSDEAGYLTGVTIPITGGLQF